MQEININRTTTQNRKAMDFIKVCKQQKIILLMILPSFIILLLFNFLPMFGIIIAFKYYKFGSIMRAPWVGFKWFEMFFQGPYFWRLLRNTLLLGFNSLIWGFPAPIILALLLNEIKHEKYKRLVQTVSYLPHFTSVVIVVGMLKQLTSLDGLFNQFLRSFGMQPVNFFAKPEYFRTLFVSSNIWQGMGWGAIIYLAALSGVDIQLYEAATIDGANRWHKLLHITLPAIVPTLCIMLILNVGQILNVDFQKVILMYNPQTYETADIFGTYTFREGIENGNYSYTTAVGLMMSVTSLIFVYVTNLISKKLTDNSIW